MIGLLSKHGAAPSLAAVAVVLSCGVGRAAADEPGRVLVQPREIDDPVTNPDMGPRAPGRRSDGPGRR